MLYAPETKFGSIWCRFFPFLDRTYVRVFRGPISGYQFTVQTEFKTVWPIEILELQTEPLVRFTEMAELELEPSVQFWFKPGSDRFGTKPWQH